MVARWFLAIGLVGLLATSNANPTIVGGKEATPHAYPFMVSLQYQQANAHYCGATLVDSTTVVTAAHCVIDHDIEKIQVMLGAHLIRTPSGDEQIIPITESHLHPNYEQRTLQHDIAVLKLERPAHYSTTVQPIALPSSHKITTGTTTILGWGKLGETSGHPNALQETTVDMVPNKDCAKIYGNSLYPTMLCAMRAGHDTCQNDSGGPLVQNGLFIGITSWGVGCASPGFPGVYTRVSDYIDFIRQYQ